MGRKTFEQVLAFGQWAYGATPVVVLSRKPLEIPSTVPNSVSHSSESIVGLCDRLEGELEAEVKLTLLGAEEFDFGFVQTRYTVGANV